MSDANTLVGIVSSYTNGMPVEAIARLYHLSAGTVRRMLKQAGIEMRTPAETAELRRRHRSLYDDQVWDSYAQTGSVALTAVNTSLPERHVRAVLARDTRRRKRHLNAHRTARRKFSDDEIRNAVFWAWDNISSKTLSHEQYREAYELSGKTLPSPATVTDRWGGWIAACEESNVLPNRVVRAYQKRWNHLNTLQAVVDFKRETNFDEAWRYEQWARGHRDRPSLSTVTSAQGGWTRVSQRADGEMEGSDATGSEDGKPGQADPEPGRV